MSLINVRYLSFANYDPFPRFFASFQNGIKAAFCNKQDQTRLSSQKKEKQKENNHIKH